MSCAEFIAESFALRTAAHLAHLSTTSFAQHLALGEFYEGIVDLVDKYAEVYMGLEGQITKFPSERPPTGNPVKLLEDYMDKVHAEQVEDKNSQALTNILAEIEELTARTLYKLQFLS